MIDYAEEPGLQAMEFLDLAQRVWPGDYNLALTQQALTRTLNFVAREDGRIIGTIRVLSDGYFFGSIPEVLVDPAFQRRGVGRKLVEMAVAASPTSLFFGAQPGKETFFERVGASPSMASYLFHKPRPI